MQNLLKAICIKGEKYSGKFKLESVGKKMENVGIPTCLTSIVHVPVSKTSVKSRKRRSNPQK